MKPSDLEDQVARIMWEAAGLDYTAEDLCDRAPAAARAAIALVLKHAAEALDAEAKRVDELPWADRFNLRQSAEGFRRAARFLRAYEADSDG